MSMIQGLLFISDFSLKIKIHSSRKWELNSAGNKIIIAYETIEQRTKSEYFNN